MPTTWIVAADASRARFLQVADRERLVEVEDLLNHPRDAFRTALTTDANPRLHGPGGQERPRGAQRRGALRPALPRRAPKFLGLIRKELGKEVGKLVADDLPEDLSWFNAREIERYFAKGSGRAT